MMAPARPVLMLGAACGLFNGADPAHVPLAQAIHTTQIESRLTSEATLSGRVFGK